MNTRPEINQLLIYNNKLYYVYGFRFDPEFIDMEEVGGKESHTLPFYMSQVLDIFLDDVPDVKNLNDLKKKYPEYLV